MFDSDLAELYGISTGRLNEQVRRNMDRFPKGFMFQLTMHEYLFLRSQIVTLEPLRSQIATLKTSRGKHRKYLAHVFTQEGVVMLSGVLRSPRAIQVNIAIMRTFVRLRELLSTHKEILGWLTELEKKYDEWFRIVFEAIQQMMREPDTPKNPIGFRPNTK
jgi:hypothetical protein